jgi:hypothetical protein
MVLFFIPKIIPPLAVFPEPHKMKESSAQENNLLFFPPAMNPSIVQEI